MKAIVLAGGLGTRLRPHTFTVPKPLLPLGDRPLLDYIITHLARQGIDEVVLALGYQAHLIREHCGDGTRYGIPLRYVQEERPLGTAGCIALARPLLAGAEAVFLMNGDIVTNLDFSALGAFHRQGDASLTIGYVPHAWQSPFGVLQLEGDTIVDIVEKPTFEHPVSAGIYVVSRAAMALVAPDTPFTMPELALRVRKEGGKVLGYRIHEFWRALETHAHFAEMEGETEILARLRQGREA